MLENDIKTILISEAEIIEKSRELGKNWQRNTREKSHSCWYFKRFHSFYGGTDKAYWYPHWNRIYGSFQLPRGTESSGSVKIIKDIDSDVAGRDILFIEDIIDTGRTLKELRELFAFRKASSIKIVTMLDKPEGRVVDIEADYTCFTIPNEFVVGFGLDYNENYRNLPYVGVLKEEVYSN